MASKELADMESVVGREPTVTTTWSPVSGGAGGSGIGGAGGPRIDHKPLPDDSAARKEVPMATGLLDYFPDALAAVAHVSYLGNQKHNPGQPTHWARGKSMDHADCIVRHLAERGGKDPAGIRHSAQLAWRALALLQEELEKEFNLPISRGSYDGGVR